MWHVVDFFELSNNLTMSWMLSIAFEIGAAASLASLIILEKMNKTIVWFLFLVLTVFQAMGNTYYAYVNIGEFQYWIELFGLNTEPLIVQKRIISTVSGAILPIVALGFIKALVDYIKPTPKEEPEIIDSRKEFEDKFLKNQEETDPEIKEVVDDKLWDIVDDREPLEPEEIVDEEKTSDFNDIIDTAIKPKKKDTNKDTYDENKKSYLDVRK